MGATMKYGIVGKYVYDEGKKDAKKDAAKTVSRKQSEIDTLKKQNENLQSQLTMNRVSMFSDLGFENRKPNGTSGGMLPM
jgi:chaperonin cofactor prefoldin